MHRYTVCSSLTDHAAHANTVNSFTTAADAISNAIQLAADAAADQYPLKLILVIDTRAKLVLHDIRL